MQDLFEDKAADWDSRPVPQQISEGVFRALEAQVILSPEMKVMDFGAGTGLLAGRIAPRVAKVLAVDVSAAMLEQLAQKTELAGKVTTCCQDLTREPLSEQVDLVVSAMAMHHVADTPGLFRALFAHLVPGGQIALADLDAEPGTFHPEDAQGVHHHGFDRDELEKLLIEAGFQQVRFVTATEVRKEDGSYPVFLVVATKGT